jgi:hypothetical protein
MEIIMIIKLDSVLEAIELAGDAYEYYLNIKTGEVSMIADQIITGIDDSEERSKLEENWKDYYKLPTKYDIHEYSIIEDFISELPKGNLKSTLENAISGRGAFRRFKEGIRRYGIEEGWYEFRDKTYKEIAIKWCRDRDLDYEE